MSRWQRDKSMMLKKDNRCTRIRWWNGIERWFYGKFVAYYAWNHAWNDNELVKI